MNAANGPAGDDARPRPPQPATAAPAQPDADAAVTQRVTPSAPPAPPGSAWQPAVQHHRAGWSPSAPPPFQPSPASQPPPAGWSDLPGPSRAPWWTHADTQAPPWASSPGAPGPGYPSGRPGSGPQLTIDLERLWPGGHAFRLASPYPVPREVQRSFLLWLAVAGLTFALVVLSVIGMIGSAGDGLGTAFVLFLFGAVLAYGAVMMRAGHRWARIMNAVLAVVISVISFAYLGLIFGVFVLYAMVATSGYGGVGSEVLVLLLAGISGLVACAVLGATIAATVYMFKRPANAFFASSSAT